MRESQQSNEKRSIDSTSASESAKRYQSIELKGGAQNARQGNELFMSKDSLEVEESVKKLSDDSIKPLNFVRNQSQAKRGKARKSNK